MSVNDNPLLSIIGGFEQGGTTLLTHILRQHPDIDGGFEGGMLLEESPRRFYQIKKKVELFREHWLLDDYQVKDIFNVDNWEEMYIKLANAFLIKNKKNIFDKYPKYMKCLTDVLNKVPDVPAVIIIRDAKAVFNSWAKRKTINTSISHDEWVRNNIDSLCFRYNQYSQGVIDAMNSVSKKRIYLVNYEKLCINTDKEAKKIFDFLNICYDKAYVEFFIDKNLRNLQKWEKKIHGAGISSIHIKEYENYLSPETCDFINNRTYNPFDYI